jgi:hypothetical protein
MARKLAFAFVTGSLLLATTTPAAAQREGALPTDAKKLDGLLVQAQGICPVMGMDLTKMGGPVKAKIGQQTIFLCCKGCLGKQINQEHWAQIQANLKAAQGVCPVRNVSLGSEAVPVVVKGRAVYVCCDAGYCIQQVQSHADKYLAIVDELLKANLARQAERRGAGRQR